MSRIELMPVGSVFIAEASVKMEAEDETAISDEVNPSRLDGVSRVVVEADDADVSISEIELTGVGVVLTTDVSAKMDVGDEVKMSEEDTTSALDEVSRDAVREDNVGGLVGRPTSDSTEFLRLAEVGVASPKPLATSDGIPVEVGTTSSEDIIGVDVATSSEDVSRGVLMSTEASWVAEAEGRELVMMFGTSSSLALDGAVTGNSEDEA